MAMTHGVLMVVAGVTEDKIEVSANVEWSGVGINLKTANPSPDAILTAVREILNHSTYRNRAQELAREYASHDTESELIALVEECIRSRAGVPA